MPSHFRTLVFAGYETGFTTDSDSSALELGFAKNRSHFTLHVLIVLLALFLNRYVSTFSAALLLRRRFFRRPGFNNVRGSPESRCWLSSLRLLPYFLFLPCQATAIQKSSTRRRMAHTILSVFLGSLCSAYKADQGSPRTYPHWALLFIRWYSPNAYLCTT